MLRVFAHAACWSMRKEPHCIFKMDCCISLKKKQKCCVDFVQSNTETLVLLCPAF